ncbi:MAG TPA: potassium channel family protein [Acidobacteriaceae bacterium]|nr:potassium channel family protein [Acidobacteriaceae bacterium]
MRTAALIAGLLLCLSVLVDAFQTIILPRRPVGHLRITRLFYIVTWAPWSFLARHISNRKAREQLYSIYGPGSLLLLLVVWAGFLLFGYALLFYALGSPFTDPLGFAWHPDRLRTDLYVSGTTLFTLGLGDVVPRSLAARTIIIFECASGLGLVALVIGYVPVLYGAFSRREVSVALLDGRAGSPPTSSELLRRHAFEGGQEALIVLLIEWERWAADILESHISYPILCYYRSQHDNQSWLSALTAVLDTCALLISVVPGLASRQAQLTFAIGRHALVDLGHVFSLEKHEARLRDASSSGRDPLSTDRLPPTHFKQLCDAMSQSGLRLCGDPDAAARLHALRALYEPHAQAIGNYLGMSLPAWIPEPRAKDQWKLVEIVRSKAAAQFTQNSPLNPEAIAARIHSEEH